MNDVEHELQCIVKDCSKKSVAKGLCPMHRYRLQKHGTTDEPPKKRDPVCTLNGCNGKHKAMGYCDLHYRRFKESGDPEYWKWPIESDRFWAKVDKGRDDECWEWKAGLSMGGYGKYSLKGNTVLAHRMSYVMANGDIPNGLFVCHSCDNRKCVNPNHLWLGSSQDNATDCLNKNRTLKGESNGNSKLNNEQVLKIRSLIRDGRSISSIARDFNISNPIIANIRDGKNWSHVR